MELTAQPPCTPGSRRASAAGFTLIELMMTILVGSILVAIAVPMFRDTAGRTRLTEQANDMVGAINMARSQAITANQRVFFCRTATSATGVCADATGTWEFWLVVNNAGTVIRRGALASHGGNMIVTSTLTNDSLNFQSDGLGRSNNVLLNDQTILVCSKHSTTDNRRVITLGSGSRVSTTRASGAC